MTIHVGSLDDFAPVCKRVAQLLGPAAASLKKVALDLFFFKFIRTVRAHAVGKFNLTALPEIFIHLFPIPVVVADFFTPCANRQKAAEGFDFGQGNAELFVPLLQMGQEEADKKGDHEETYLQIADDIDHRAER